MACHLSKDSQEGTFAGNKRCVYSVNTPDDHDGYDCTDYDLMLLFDLYHETSSEKTPSFRDKTRFLQIIVYRKRSTKKKIEGNTKMLQLEVASDFR